MWFLRGGGGGGGAAAVAGRVFSRYFSRKRSTDLRRINPKVPREEATAISRNLYQIVKNNGPLSVSDTWNHTKETGINGLNSKTHMKILLKWMMGRKMLKLSCTHVRNAKKFHYSILPEDPQANKNVSSPSPAPDTPKASGKVKKQHKKTSRKGK
ncbi:hypothetical protein OPV22_001596 [Ensete ventricosum]|uniref:H15 domain-containing protein n=1 Tax=Ensete ventricosum TaxID=4639 RepID=A0AAV8RWE4_ENSVE|nr:hypothetical protein OPV22_001596 [Ensete ventricosum]